MCLSSKLKLFFEGFNYNAIEILKQKLVVFVFLSKRLTKNFTF